MTRDEAIELIVLGMLRGERVPDWPEDERIEHRTYQDHPDPATGLVGSFQQRSEHMARYRAGKVYDQLFPAEVVPEDGHPRRLCPHGVPENSTGVTVRYCDGCEGW